MPAYVPSGRIDVARLLVAAPLGLALSAVLGAAYQLAQQGIPLLWFAVLFTLGAALLLAMLTGALSRSVRSRGSPMIATIGAVWGLGAVAGSFIAAYLSHVLPAMHHGQISSEGADAVDLPGFLAYLHGRIAEGWTIGHGRELNGPFVVAAWLGEAALLVYAAARGVLPTAQAPFCERCRRFATPALRRVVEVDASALRAAGARGDLDAVIAVPRSAGKSRQAQYVIRACPTCHERAWLDVRLASASARLEYRSDRGPASWLEESLAACVASLAALGTAPAKRSPDHPVRSAEITPGQAEMLHERLAS